MKPITLIKALLIIILIMTYFIVDANPSYKGPGKGMPRKTDSIIHLELDGKIHRSHVKGSAIYTVTLIQCNTPIKSIVVKEGKNFGFTLKEHAWYAVEIKREGHIPKLISIHTEVPHTKYHHKKYKLAFDIGELLSHDEAKHLNDDAIDFPIAIVAFDKNKEAFYIDEEYYTNIRKNVMASLITP